MTAVNGIPFVKYFTKNLLIATFLIGISVFNYGFDQTGYSTIQAMDRKSMLSIPISKNIKAD